MRRALALAVILVSLAVQASPAEAAKGDSKNLQAAQRRANQAAARLATAQTQLARAEREVAELEEKNRTTQARLSSLESQVKALAVRQYVTGPRAQDWFGSDDPSRAARAQAMVRFVTQSDTDAVDAYRAARQDLDESQAALSGQLGARKDAVAKLRSQRAAAVKELNRLAALQKAEDARRKRTTGGRTGPGGVRIIGSGSWICPVQGPRAFSNDWGNPRSGGRRHQGTDVLAPRGTPVVAPVAGTARRHNSGLGGLSFYLSGDDGNTYYGAHLDSVASTGRVVAGTVVGTVGNSGNARGGPPHLHFEIHPGGGGAINPYPTLRAHC